MPPGDFQLPFRPHPGTPTSAPPPSDNANAGPALESSLPPPPPSVQLSQPPPPPLCDLCDGYHEGGECCLNFTPDGSCRYCAKSGHRKDNCLEYAALDNQTLVFMYKPIPDHDWSDVQGDYTYRRCAFKLKGVKCERDVYEYFRGIEREVTGGRFQFVGEGKTGQFWTARFRYLSGRESVKGRFDIRQPWFSAENAMWHEWYV